MLYIKKSLVKKRCINCQTEFETSLSFRTFCTKQCNNKFSYKYRINLGLPTGTVGAMAELLVSVDLMKKGYEVFRALSPASSCDVLALKNEKLLTFEIRSGHYNAKDKSLNFPKTNIKAKNLAIVIWYDNSIHYIPDFNNFL